MNKPLDFEKLQILFGRAATLPPLPHGTLRLIMEIDGDQSSAARLERVIGADPPLAAEVIRLASGAHSGDQSNITSLRQAILLLGQRSLRSLAVSLSLKTLARPEVLTRKLDAVRIVRHSLFVGIMARYLHARAFDRKDLLDACWTGEELLAAGVLHELGLCLLAKVDPAGFNRVWTVAEVLKVDLNEAFTKCFDGQLSSLSAAAARAWGFPQMLIDAQAHIADPTGLPEQIRGLVCLQYADQLASRFGEGHCHFAVGVETNALAVSLLKVPDEELCVAAKLISADVTFLLGPDSERTVDRSQAA
jgi:HD-like signal output (HDOD) protein